MLSIKMREQASSPDSEYHSSPEGKGAKMRARGGNRFSEVLGMNHDMLNMD